MSPYYEDDAVTIYHGDVRETDPEAVVACVVTSPPYNVGIEYDEHDDVMPWAGYMELACGVARACAERMIVGGRAWVNVVPVVPTVPNPPGDHSGRCSKTRVGLLRLWWDALLQGELDVWDVVSWASARGPGTAWGSWRSPAGPNLRGEWEAILVAYKGLWQRETPAAFRGWKDDDGEWTRLTSNSWAMQPQSRNPHGHPVPFPTELPARAIRLSTFPGETVLDPFMGSGTTLRAAKDLGRKAIGFDISERYCELAALRCGQGVFDFDSGPAVVDVKAL